MIVTRLRWSGGNLDGAEPRLHTSYAGTGVAITLYDTALASL